MKRRSRTSYIPVPTTFVHDSGTPPPGQPRIRRRSPRIERLMAIEACCDSMRRYTDWIQEEQREPEPDMAYILGRQMDRRVSFYRLRQLRQEG